MPQKIDGRKPAAESFVKVISRKSCRELPADFALINVFGEQQLEHRPYNGLNKENLR